MAHALAGLAQKLGSPADALKRQQRMNDDVEFLLSHMEEWREAHPNRWIAVHNRALVAVADTQEKVIAAVETKGIPLSQVILDFVSEQRVAYLL